jgi:hypothetical protein
LKLPAASCRELQIGRAYKLAYHPLMDWYRSRVLAFDVFCSEAMPENRLANYDLLFKKIVPILLNVTNGFGCTIDA